MTALWNEHDDARPCGQERAFGAVCRVRSQVRRCQAAEPPDFEVAAAGVEEELDPEEEDEDDDEEVSPDELDAGTEDDEPLRESVR